MPITIITSKLPPKNTIILITHYLVINSNNLIDKKILIEATLQLSFKEIQFNYLKKNNLVKIPFEFSLSIYVFKVFSVLL
jgi:hypothetical protein